MADEGSSLFLCPHCGAFVSDSSSLCPNCGKPMEDTDDEELELGLEELEPVEQDALSEPEPDAASGDSESVTLFLCSVCGAFTASNADKCSQCGASMLETEEPESQPMIQADEPEAEVMDLLVEAEPEDIDAELDFTEDSLLEDLKHIESPEDVMHFIESITDEEPEPDEQSSVQDTEQSEQEPAPSPTAESADLLSQLVFASDDLESEDDDDRSNAISAVENMLDDMPFGSKGSDDTIAMCNNCGAFVSESAEVCNVCGKSLAGGQKFIPEAETVPEEDPEEQQADSIIRSLLGVDKDVELEKAHDQFESDGSLGLCTVCGAFISQEADACTVCGTHIEDMPEFVPSVDLEDKLTDNKQLALCPHCGVFIQEGATECMSCVKPIPEGAKLEIVDGVEEPEDDWDAAFSRLKTFLGVEKTLEMEPVRDQSMSGLDICPDCGAFVSRRAVSCSVCGNELFDMEAAEEQASPKPERMECPNCGSKIASDSPECPLCGMAFGEPDALELEGTAEDITDFLEAELAASLKNIEDEAGVELPETKPEPEPVPEITEMKKEDDIWADDGLDVIKLEDDLTELLVEEEPVESIEEQQQESEGLPFEESQITEPAPIRPVPVGDFIEEHEDEPIDEYQEPLEFLDDEAEDLEFIDMSEEPEEEYVEEEIVEEIPVDRDLSRFDTGSARPRPKPANWATGIYVSVAAICFFLGFYAIVPGPSYAPGLAVIFGTLLLIGVYLAFTERGTFFKGDVKRGATFYIGITLASMILLHWPLGFMTDDRGALGQPGLDRLMLSLSILIISIGVLWIRARVRYVFTWFGGIILLFMGMLMQYTYDGWSDSSTSPVVLVSGLGASLVFISLIFLQYERAINTSIESDIVRGDAHYLKHDYKGALKSYDDALAKSQIKRVEVLGSPLIEYDVPWYSKGSALILMGEYEEGIKCFDMALAINPNNEVTWVNKGNAHSKLGEHDVAMECYQRAIEVNPFYEIAWNNLGNVMARRKEYVEALKHYNRAIKINPKYDDAWINKGYVLAKMGKREQAIKCLSHVGSRAKMGLPGSEREEALSSDA